MRPAPFNLSIPSVPDTFAPPVSPGCPTDSIVLDRSFLPPWATDVSPPLTSIVRSVSWNTTAPQDPSSPSSLWPVEPGSYIAFALDTVAAATSTFPESSTGHAHIRELPVSRYVGLVSSATTSDLVVHLAGSTSVSGQIGKHCLPIAPAQGGLEPAHDAAMFPWADGVQSTALGVRVVANALAESALRFGLSEEGFGQFEEAVVRNCCLGGETAGIIDARVPVHVWRDVREAEWGADPMGFIEELSSLERLLHRYNRSEDDGNMADDEESMDEASQSDFVDDSDFEGDTTIRVDDD